MLCAAACALSLGAIVAVLVTARRARRDAWIVARRVERAKDEVLETLLSLREQLKDLKRQMDATIV